MWTLLKIEKAVEHEMTVIPIIIGALGTIPKTRKRDSVKQTPEEELKLVRKIGQNIQ